MSRGDADLNATQTAAALNVSTVDLKRMREEGTGPEFYTLDGKDAEPGSGPVRYTRAMVEEWIEATYAGGLLANADGGR